jgi:hypothetical protein
MGADVWAWVFAAFALLILCLDGINGAVENCERGTGPPIGNGTILIVGLFA